MSQTIRQMRLRAKELDFNAMVEDMALLNRLAELRVPKGRKSADILTSFTARHSQVQDIPAKFLVTPYGQALNKFMESGERLSVISIEGRDPTYIRQRLARLGERAGLPIKAQVINQEVYLERTDKPEKKA